jgi:hypothetical protein
VGVAGYGFSQVHEWAAGVVQSGESPRRLTVAMMAALLQRRSPCWGHHGEALRSRCRGGSQGENLVLLDVRRRRLGGVTFSKASFLEPRR